MAEARLHQTKNRRSSRQATPDKEPTKWQTGYTRQRTDGVADRLHQIKNRRSSRQATPNKEPTKWQRLNKVPVSDVIILTAPAEVHVGRAVDGPELFPGETDHSTKQAVIDHAGTEKRTIKIRLLMIK